LNKIKEKGVQVEKVTLHVGLGTFLPVKTEDIERHKMHQEYCVLNQKIANRLNRAKAQGKKIIAVGTTALRLLESRAQNDGKLLGGEGWTDIFIYPGYQFQFVDKLVTNFHLPKSTLLMLVSAFAARDLIQKSYQEAIREKYRFFSFGDAMFIE
jgi:S-adenosylmethionine:tRNA ribosyltransferase-isomerase